MGFPGGTVIQNPPANAEDVSSVPGSGRSPGVGNGNALQYSCLENSMDRGAWWATVPELSKSLENSSSTQLKKKIIGGFPGGSAVKKSPVNAENEGSIPGLGRSLRKGNGNLLQYSYLGNPMDREAWQATDHGVKKSRT